MQMTCKINDGTLIDDIEGLRDIVKKKKEELVDPQRSNFEHPLDEEIIGNDGLLSVLKPVEGCEIPYARASELDRLWCSLLKKAIVCLRYFDAREPFVNDAEKTIVAYGVDKLVDYHSRYAEFEGVLYGSNPFYRDHVFHVVRVWMLGIDLLLNKEFESSKKQPFIGQMTLDAGAESPKEINMLEYISMWTIVALCHDLGYPLEKSQQILEKTKTMMSDFVPNPNIWSNFYYSGTQDNINEYILKFMSTKMKSADKNDSDDSAGFVGRIQPKYYLKYAKSLEGFHHGIISSIIIYKSLLYFLEADFNLNDDYKYSDEDAKQFYIRREILRAISSHTCSDAYNIHVTTFSSLLFLCDELQEWGRRTWGELYSGIDKPSATELSIKEFSPHKVDVEETVHAISLDGAASILGRLFLRQYSHYRKTFRDGQDTAKRDFELTKKIVLEIESSGSTVKRIVVNYSLPVKGESKFVITFEEIGERADGIIQMVKSQAENSLYSAELICEPELSGRA